MKVGKKYKLLGAVFDDSALLENAGIFELTVIEGKGTTKERYGFKGVSTSRIQACYKTTVEIGLAIIQEVD